MEGARGRKHGLKVLSVLDNGPASKKTKSINGASINQWRDQTEVHAEVTQETRLPPLRAGKRKKGSGSPEIVIENDENVFNDLEESVKRLRLRPIIFSITSFIEQNVDLISYNLTDTEPELVVLHLPPQPQIPDPNVNPSTLRTSRSDP